MNGKRILVKLIWLFVGVNIVLFASNYILKYKEYRVSAERMNNIEAVLEKNKIKVTCKLPETHLPKRPAELNFEGSSARYMVEKNFFGNDLASVKHSVDKNKENPDSNDKIYYCTFNNEVLAFDGNAISYNNQSIVHHENNLSNESAKRLCDELITRVDPKRKMAYKIESIRKDGYWEMTYYPLLDDVPIWDNNMKFKVCQEGVISAVMHMGNVTVISDEKKAIYPVDLMLFGLIDGMKKDKEVQISDISLVYKQLTKEGDMWGQQIVPSYKITIVGLEEPVFVNAYTNEIIKTLK